MSEQAARELAVNGITLHVATWGEWRGPERAVVLVHGLTANSQYWSEVGRALAERGWYAVAPDLRGRGLSAKPPHGYGPPVHANDLLSLADALGLETINLVGHSLGAIIGLVLGAVYPARTGRLALVDAGGTIPADTAQAIAPATNRLGTVYPSLGAYLAAMSAVAPFAWDPFWERYYRYDADIRPDGTVVSRVPAAAIAEEMFVMGAIRTELLPNFVRATTLIVRATVGLLGPERGFILTPDEAERVRGIIPGGRLVEIPETNHYTVVRAPAFLETLGAWLEDA